ncbi:hypothetical protein TSOC_006792 [Tetrabaena socialis]|uniref:Uncharacterized protein n=1 Tax=Tetrabaena socialis TaxID=47790 RepID=A0A2J8A2Q8_9CHLO|nr:hypothetical protein TSOC_006792 [Tetrabaena socialis]|eukprot:PNH06809.1 hypothetical protein TSOC_006792 [Tetrabaena socialis]
MRQVFPTPAAPTNTTFTKWSSIVPSVGVHTAEEKEVVSFNAIALRTAARSAMRSAALDLGPPPARS